MLNKEMIDTDTHTKKTTILSGITQFEVYSLNMDALGYKESWRQREAGRNVQQRCGPLQTGY